MIVELVTALFTDYQSGNTFDIDSTFGLFVESFSMFDSHWSALSKTPIIVMHLLLRRKSRSKVED